MPTDPIVRVHNAAIVEAQAAVDAVMAQVKADATLGLADAETMIAGALKSLRTDG